MIKRVVEGEEGGLLGVFIMEYSRESSLYGKHTCRMTQNGIPGTNLNHIPWSIVFLTAPDLATLPRNTHPEIHYRYLYDLRQ